MQIFNNETNKKQIKQRLLQKSMLFHNIINKCLLYNNLDIFYLDDIRVLTTLSLEPASTSSIAI